SHGAKHQTVRPPGSPRATVPTGRARLDIERNYQKLSAYPASNPPWRTDESAQPGPAGWLQGWARTFVRANPTETPRIGIYSDAVANRERRRLSRFRSYPAARQRHRFAITALTLAKQSSGGAATKTEVRDHGQRSHQGIGRAGQRHGEGSCRQSRGRRQ